MGKDKKDKEDKKEKKDKKDKDDKKDKKDKKDDKKDKKDDKKDKKDDKKDKKDKKDDKKDKKDDKKDKKDDKKDKKDDKKDKKDDKKDKKDDKKDKKDDKKDKKDKKDDKKDKKDDKKDKKDDKKDKKDDKKKKDEEDSDGSEPESEEQVEGGYPDSFIDDEDLPEQEKQRRQELRSAYLRGVNQGKEICNPTVDAASRPNPRPVVTAPVAAKEDWAPVEWPKWQGLLMDGQDGLDTHPTPYPRIALGSSANAMSPQQRVAALYGAHNPSPYHNAPARIQQAPAARAAPHGLSPHAREYGARTDRPPLGVPPQPQLQYASPYQRALYSPPQEAYASPPPRAAPRQQGSGVGGPYGYSGYPAQPAPGNVSPTRRGASPAWL